MDQNITDAGKEVISFKTSLIILLLGGIFIGLFVSIFNVINSIRVDQVLNAYTNETNAYIEANRLGVEKLFSQTFANDISCTWSGELNCLANDHSRAVAISELIKDNLKDYSSTAFLKLVGDKILVLTLSGQIQNFPESYNDNKPVSDEVRKLLRGQVSSLPWADYSYLFSGKEVIIPVKMADGRVVGAIMRRVIE